MNEVAKRKVTTALWRRYDLSYKLEEHQLDVYTKLKEAAKQSSNRSVLNASRRWGKTFLLALLCIEYALSHPNCTILYCAASQLAVKDFVLPTMQEVFKDCPEDLRGAFRTQSGRIIFNNGSNIRLTGVEGPRLRKLRGITAHMVVVDEAGFVDNLKEAVQSVLGPMTVSTRGQTIISSNAPLLAGHDFTTVFVREAEESGNYHLRTIYSVKKYSTEDIERFARDCGGINSTTFKREYLCQPITDESNAVIPEWGAQQSLLVRNDIPRPEFFYPMVSGDIGLVDFCGVLFGYYHFAKGFMVVEDELLMKGVNSKQLVEACKRKESDLWGSEGPVKRPVRVFDGQPFTINDMTTIFKYNTMTPEGKIPTEAQVNKIRLKIQGCTLLIHPRCVQLIGQLTDATWNKTRTEFARDRKNGHFDLIAALQYFVQYINIHSNPFPAGYEINDMRSTIHGLGSRVKEQENKQYQGLKKIWGPRDDAKEDEDRRYRSPLARIFGDSYKGPKGGR